MPTTVRHAIALVWTGCLLGIGQLGCAPAGVDDSVQPVTEPSAPEGSAHARLEQVFSRSPKNLRVHALADGTKYVEVVSGFRHATVVTLTDAGVKSHCVTSTDDALRLLEGRAQ
jgi:hypothetical protein